MRKEEAHNNSHVINVVLVDDHAAVRAGYRLLLEAEPNIEVVAELSTGEEAYQQYDQLPADVVILDISMPGMGGLETIRRIIARNDAARILVFTMHDSPVFAENALNSGALGYITKSSAPTELVAAVKKVARGTIYLDPAISQHFASEKSAKKTSIFSNLSNREFQILCLCAEGSDVPEIAERLSLSSKTVSNYLTQIKEKLGVNSTAQLVRLALQHNLASV